LTVNNGLIRDVEVLRAVAVLGVIFQHMHGNLFPKFATGSAASQFFSSGWVGVDLFFAISGFVIARSLIPKAAAAHTGRQFRLVSYRFWTTRLFRLAPSAWLWLIVILILCVSYNDSGVFGDLKTNAWWTLSGIFNFSNYVFVQYFGAQKPGASFVYWSLSLEEQFYLLFPFALWFFRRYVGWFFSGLVLWQVFEPRGLYGMMFRTDAIALGVLVGLCHQHPVCLSIRGALDIRVSRVLVLLLLGTLFFLGSFNQRDLPVQVGLVALVSGALVWLCAGKTDVLAGNGTPSRVFLWLGQRSYAMYLIHIPVMFFIRETAFRLDRTPADGAVVSAIIALFLILVLAAANFRWLEAPLRNRGKVLAAKLGRERLHPSQ
jgi:peptidoglycan/LPS O-acetylase OafA/YrhL